MAIDSLRLTRLLQLASPALPIGAYHYSQALEQAVAESIVNDRESLRIWLSDQMTINLGRWELPLLVRLHAAFASGDIARATALNNEFVASRESAELRTEAVQMGRSLLRLIPAWPGLDRILLELLAQEPEPSMPFAFSGAAAMLAISREEALTAYLWAWLENQAAAAQKSFAIGQSAAQSLLYELAPHASEVVASAMTLPDEQLSSACPGLALLSARHETRYSRLFRS